LFALLDCGVDAVQQSSDPSSEPILQARQRPNPPFNMSQCIERESHAGLNVGQRHTVALADFLQEHDKWMPFTPSYLCHGRSIGQLLCGDNGQFRTYEVCRTESRMNSYAYETILPSYSQSWHNVHRRPCTCPSKGGWLLTFRLIHGVEACRFSQVLTFLLTEAVIPQS
jgi:hypothetical protein